MDVSVLVPVYNTAAYLNQCLASIAHSSLSIEIICLNDGSTDESLEVMQHAAKRDTRIAIIDKDNEGYGATLNKGLAIAQGRYIAIIEPDDYLEGDMLSALFELAGKNDFPDVVKSAYWQVDDSGSQKSHCSYWGRIKTVGEPIQIEEAPLLLRYHPSIWSAIYRREFLIESGITFVEASGAGWADNPFLIETMFKAKSIVYTDDSFYCYRDGRIGSSTASIGDYRVPFDRWNEMTDILESCKVRNKTIWGIHAYRAFYYFTSAQQASNFNEDDWIREVQAAISRLRPEIIARSPFVSPQNRALYEQLTGKRLENASNVPYYRMLIQEAFWKVRQNGAGYLINRVHRKKATHSV